MDGQKLRPGVLQYLGEIDTGTRILFKAYPEFDGDVLARKFERAHYLRRLLGFFEQRAALAVADDLGDGTAHIDVDDVELFERGMARRRQHDLGLSAEDLHRLDLFRVRRVEQVLRLYATVDQALCRDHLGVGERRSGACAKSAETDVAEPCYRREHRFRGVKYLGGTHVFSPLPKVRPPPLATARSRALPRAVRARRTDSRTCAPPSTARSRDRI